MLEVGWLGLCAFLLVIMIVIVGIIIVVIRKRNKKNEEYSIKVGNVCRIVEIHPDDPFQSQRGRFIRKRVRILNIGNRYAKKFRGYEVVFLDDAVSRMRGDRIHFTAVILEKISE